MPSSPATPPATQPATQPAGATGGTAPEAGTPPADPGAAAPAAKAIDPKQVNNRVRKVVGLREKEQQIAKEREALAAKAKELEALQELGTLAKKNPGQALRRILGVPDGEVSAELTGFLKAVSQEIVGTEGEQKALEALPKSVQERLAKVGELEARLASVGELEAQVKELVAKRNEAVQSLEQRQRVDAARQAFDAGMGEVKKAEKDLALVLQHPESERLLGEKWAQLVEERGKAGKISGPQDAVALVREAAGLLQAELEERLGWVLNTDWGRAKLSTQSGPPGSGTEAPRSTTPPAPTGSKGKPPRTGTPASLGGAAQVPWKSLPHSERRKQLRELERAGHFRSSTPTGQE